MKRLSLLALFCGLFFQVRGQYHYLPLAGDVQIAAEHILLDTGVYFHHGVRAYNYADLRRVDSNWRPGVMLSRPNYWSNKRFGRWANRKLFNESFVILKGEDYRIEANPILNLELGTADAATNAPFLNTRGVWIEGRLGRQFSFYTMVAENQGRFPDYYRDFFADNITVLGWGKLNQLGESGTMDFPMVMGGICYKPSKYFTFSLSQGKQFFGEGYRSMILSDYSLPNANFKIETDFGKRVKYVNLYSVYLDPRSVARVNGFDLRKYTSLHYLSWNVNSRLNISVFESMVWVGDSANPNQGFDIHFLNPIIMYRQVEKVIGGKGGNAMIGLSASYQAFRNSRIYGQFAIDDFSVESLSEVGQGNWLNFFSGQLGIKFSRPLDIEGLFLQLEYNSARPFMYAHRTAETNYTHHLLPLAHPWGSSFRELLLRAKYQNDRMVYGAQISYGEAATDPAGRNLGNNLFSSIFDRQGEDYGFHIAKGNSFNLLTLQAKLGYIVNARTGAQIEVGYRYRGQFSRVEAIESQSLNWWFGGLRTPLFDSYYDF